MGTYHDNRVTLLGVLEHLEKVELCRLLSLRRSDERRDDRDERLDELVDLGLALDAIPYEAHQVLLEADTGHHRNSVVDGTEGFRCIVAGRWSIQDAKEVRERER